MQTATSARVARSARATTVSNSLLQALSCSRIRSYAAANEGLATVRCKRSRYAEFHAADVAAIVASYAAT
jgi:hypothetical protein